MAVTGGRPLAPRDLPGILAKSPLPRVFVLLGDEQVLKDETTDAIAAAIGRAGAQPERHRADAEDESLRALCATHLVGSLFATAKLIVFSRVEKAPVDDRRTFYKELSQGEFHPSITVVAHSSERNLPSGVDAKGIVPVMFWPLNQASDVEGWIRSLLGRLSLKADRDVPTFLHRRFGSDLGLIRCEVEKAALVAGGRPLTVELLENVVSAPAGQELFAVLDALVAGRTREALSGLEDLWARGEPPQKVVPLVLIQFHRLLRVAALHEVEPGRFVEVLRLSERHREARGFFQQKAIEKEMGPAFSRALAGTAFEDALADLKPVAIAPLVAQLARTRAASVRRMFERLLALDFRMKTSSVDPQLALEILAVDAREPAAGRGPSSR